MYCISDKICSKCAGKRPEVMNIRNIGLTASALSNDLMNKQMKKRHKLKITLDSVNIDNLLIKNK
jgi:hypothetical protein